MQCWYEKTVERVVPQIESLPDFLVRQDLDLLQLNDNQKCMLEEKFTMQEVKHAIQEANEDSSPGPSGQVIVIFKLLFMTLSHVMMTALSQLVLVPCPFDTEDFWWSHHRKVVYIPKVPKLATPAD
jgi:hypothetical protein